MECVYLKEAKYIKDFQVYVSFNDGKSGIIDLRDIVFKYNIAIPLREPKNCAGGGHWVIGVPTARDKMVSKGVRWTHKHTAY